MPVLLRNGDVTAWWDQDDSRVVLEQGGVSVALSRGQLDTLMHWAMAHELLPGLAAEIREVIRKGERHRA
jgi:hypothetical protein